jgi:glycosyltransferase involved in cell wall biosynthesis
LDDALRFECAYESINWVGEVEDIAPVILSSAAGIAPALSGAGVRGKIHQYSALGIPCVASTISAASLKYIHGISIFRADSPLDFSRYCLALLSNEKLAKNMGSQAKKLCLTEYTWDSMEPDIKKLYSLD